MTTTVASFSGFKISGTITYNADFTYSSMTVSSGDQVVTLPASCLTSDYCVKGSTLTLSPHARSAMAGMSSSSGLTGSILLTKQ